MTIIVKTESVPSDLPPANLYIDEIEEIVSIAVAAGQILDSQAPEVPPEVSFEIGNQICDKISDLEKIGGITGKLSVQVTMESPRSIFFFRLFLDRFSTTWSSHGLTEEDEWKVYRRLKALFELRKRKFRAIFEGQAVLLYLFLLLLVLLLAGFMNAALAKKAVELKSSLPFWTGVPLGALFGFLTIKNHTIVYLRRRPARGTWTDVIKRNEVWLAAIVGAAVGAIAGSAATVLAERLVRRWWP